MTPIRAYMLIADGEPSLEDLFLLADSAVQQAYELRLKGYSAAVIAVEIREVRDASGN